MKHAGPEPNLRDKALAELREFWYISIYLILFLGCFNLYRRLILEDAHLPYISYGFRLVEALIVAKIVLIGEALGLGRSDGNRPLFVSVLRKVVLFGLFIVAFSIIEHAVEALLHHEDWHGVVRQVLSIGYYEMLARTLVMLIALIPFFAFVELERVLGPGTLARLFFHGRAGAR